MKEILLHPAEVSEFAIVTFTPGKHLPVHSEGRGVPATCNIQQGGLSKVVHTVRSVTTALPGLRHMLNKCVNR